ncbi:glycoside hydrolase family 43 protein [Plebeiibacterium sediminum]|uniref:Glycoside hydrolase family 43 protein n=1 Tax=Plebeiibacterium sediminum TaxID=2992112 RepID=A0AAE3M736_9BACT|nr:glycoside hydrolase family 43 protein [Plebeiobacterium sediminum]MCW3788030.1 glycoside hydrolase family 43 protein [Plebeiobacterium sediminum]
MNRMIAISILQSLLCFFSFVSCSANDTEGIDDPVTYAKVPLGDPFILLHNGTYYAYGTQSADGIVVYTSDDMENWRIPSLTHGNLALYKDDVWGDRWFWAPEVYEIDGTFYMYFSADEHTCVATSDSPLGPFVQENKVPIIQEEKSIDNSLFIDEDGKAYMYFVRFNDGNNVWVAEMTEDLKGVKEETFTKCINVSQVWEEVWPRVNEGPFVKKHNGLYYMTYSANSFESPMYGVGFATSESPYGPWVKYEGNPILQSPGQLIGAGHSALFYGKDGALYKVFHAHNSAQSIHPRKMYISKVLFKSGNKDFDVMEIESEYITPVIGN